MYVAAVGIVPLELQAAESYSGDKQFLLHILANSDFCIIFAHRI